MNLKSKKFKAFSLIELSIVILIIGILVAGVTQSSRLISQFKLSSARNISISSPVSSIKDLALWLDAVNEKSFNNNIQISDQENISSWIDINPLSTSGFALTQSNVADQPKYALNGINGLPSVKYNSAINTTRLASNDVGILKRQSTFFSVMRYDSVNASLSHSYFLTIGNSSTPSLESSVSIGTLSFQYYPSYAPGNNFQSTSFLKDTNYILRRTYNPKANTATLHLNGALAYSGIASYDGNFNDSLTYMVLGNHPSAPRTYGGFFGEFIYFNRVLSADEIKDVENYLSRKWGIKIN